MPLSTHPLENFKYCPQCGRETFENYGERAKRCSSCQLTYFHNVAAAVALFVRDNSGRYLFVRRAFDPAKGTLDLPGGFIDPLERAEEAVSRELLEETGLTPKSIRYLSSRYNIYPYSGIDIYTCDLIYLVEVEELATARPMDDAGEIILAHISEIRAEDFGLHSIHRLMLEVVEHSDSSLAELYV